MVTKFVQLKVIQLPFSLISVPIAFALLPNKKQASYLSAFNGIKRRMDELGLNGLTCSYAIADFETNIKTCFLQVWPGIAFRHCLFHFKQAIWRKVSISGMAKVYRIVQNVVFRTFVKATMSLPFVPIARMPEAVEIIKAMGKEMKKLSHVKFFGNFMNYLQNQWLRHMDEEWLRSWNIYSKTGSSTNNVSEAYNRVFANTTFFINAHPPIFLWVKVVINELNQALSKANSSDAGNPEKSNYAVDKKAEKINQQRTNLMVQVGQHTLSMQDYLNSMGHTLIQPDDPVLEDIEHEAERQEQKKKERRQSHQNVSRK